MSKASLDEHAAGSGRRSASKAYKHELRRLQVELVKLQRQVISSNDKILVILEGRDAAGKDGAIKRIVQHLSPREVRVVALGKPSDRDQSAWYFQRYVAQLPVCQELVLFNRSWYNRAGVERVMGFCTEAEHEDFMNSVVDFEMLLAGSGIRLIKYYLDISKDEQRRRLKDRATDPLKQWKISPIDEQAIHYWKQYSAARNEMLTRTSTPGTPWRVVRTDNKREARLNIIRDLLGQLQYKGKDEALTRADREVVFPFHTACIESGGLAP
ncbi:polyphosphate kinase 2 [Cupriavidus basilensis]|uniref:ADP/GDP-polyphosphate phosphotransferase n=1 Tax=Cupriavidus basilensis TaxID=68895 RepID=A0ABT6AHI7_9BURK|nr:polyphosphate kinase 2 [Cupriavidus basilensis]MDF3832073.1 polyphosphate kinase 2 [Cupriavidus basilensis]